MQKYLTISLLVTIVIITIVTGFLVSKTINTIANRNPVETFYGVSNIMPPLPAFAVVRTPEGLRRVLIKDYDGMLFYIEADDYFIEECPIPNIAILGWVIE